LKIIIIIIIIIPPRERAHYSHWIRERVRPRSGVKVFEKKRFFRAGNRTKVFRWLAHILIIYLSTDIYRLKKTAVKR
jgi:hypothetical protein